MDPRESGLTKPRRGARNVPGIVSLNPPRGDRLNDAKLCCSIATACRTDQRVEINRRDRSAIDRSIIAPGSAGSATGTTKFGGKIEYGGFGAYQFDRELAEILGCQIGP